METYPYDRHLLLDIGGRKPVPRHSWPCVNKGTSGHRPRSRRTNRPTAQLCSPAAGERRSLRPSIPKWPDSGFPSQSYSHRSITGIYTGHTRHPQLPTPSTTPRGPLKRTHTARATSLARKASRARKHSTTPLQPRRTRCPRIHQAPRENTPSPRRRPRSRSTIQPPPAQHRHELLCTPTNLNTRHALQRPSAISTRIRIPTTQRRALARTYLLHGLRFRTTKSHATNLPTVLPYKPDSAE